MEALRQWLLACNSVNHSLDEHASAIAQFPAYAWRKEEHGRLHQLAGALAFLQQPDPLLSAVLAEINSRPAGQIGNSSKTVTLYGLQAIHLLSSHGALRTAGRLDAHHASTLGHWLEKKSELVRRQSQLESVIAAALQESGLQPVQDVTIGHGLSADFRCLANSTVGGRHGIFYVEVDGPSHFCVRPRARPRGRTVLKRRIIEAMGHKLVSIPYWHVGPRGHLAQDEGSAAPLAQWRPARLHRQHSSGMCAEDLQALIASQLST